MWTYKHNNFQVYQLPALRDNYIYMVSDNHSDTVLVIDPTLAEPVLCSCSKLGLKPTHILNTHHHWDHTDGNRELVDTFQCEVVANKADAERIPNISLAINAGEPFKLGSLSIQVLDLPGHTLGHIAFVIDDALFCGDTLFGGGCGRLFEGSFEQMWGSLQKLATLDEQTKVYCAHEYTLPNLKFAREIDPDNASLTERIQSDTQTRRNKQPTIPSTIDLEKQTNPFLWPLNDKFCKTYNPELSSLEVFRDIRHRKDAW